MKNLLASLLLLGFVSSANAMFINNGDNTVTDNISGLDWLALSETNNQAYSQAETLHVGWRYASNNEIEDMLTTLFPNFTDNTGYGYADSHYSPVYTDIHSDVDAFRTLFGASGGKELPQTYGLYADENGRLSLAGVVREMPLTKRSLVFGSDYDYDFSRYADTALEIYGTYLVRAAVPEAASIFLLAFGLLGLIGVRAKRKSVS